MHPSEARTDFNARTGNEHGKRQISGDDILNDEPLRRASVALMTAPRHIAPNRLTQCLMNPGVPNESAKCICTSVALDQRPVRQQVMTSNAIIAGTQRSNPCRERKDHYLVTLTEGKIRD